jgi:hypothetical protein
MTEVVIWTPRRFDFDLSANTLYENPKNGFLHNYEIKIKRTSLTSGDFLLNLEWDILEARLKPQCHIVIIDSKNLTHCPTEWVNKVCSCAISFTITHPMKYLVFYDPDCALSNEEIEATLTFNQFLNQQISNLDSYVKLVSHSGASLTPKFTSNGQLGPPGMKQLARGIMMKVHEIFGSND